MLKINLIKGDCLERMKEIPDKSVDMVLTDPPYGSTNCKWDSIIPLQEMWAEIKRIVKNEHSAILIFGAEPFSSALRMSNVKDFKYDWVWRKDKPTGHLNCKKQPMRETEIISVFYSKQCAYHPQLVVKNKKDVRPATGKRKNTPVYGEMQNASKREIPIEMGYPKNILSFVSAVENGDKGLHPTQKPVALLEYLVKTYTKEGDTVLDFTMGSGSTGVACKNTGRVFVGIERDDKYFEIAQKRLEANAL